MTPSVIISEISSIFDYKVNVHVASTGSIYVTVSNGILGQHKFRISDHDQPSHYQIRNYTNVNSISDIITSLNSGIIEPMDEYIDIIDGVKCSIGYDYKTCEHVFTPIN